MSKLICRAIHAYVAFMCICTSDARAISFGAFDPRSLAMGGAGVVSGNSANAAYFNPALLAMFKTRKERGKNSKLILPTITSRYADAAETLQTVEDQHLDQRMVNAINTFNQDVNSDNARLVLQAAQDVEDNLDQLLDGPVYLDANAGIVLGIGHKYEGGSIIINRRIVGDGVIQDFESDLALLNDYMSAMEFIEGGGDPAAAATMYPNIFAADGSLIDQTSNLNSTAVGSAVSITEIGMAMSKQFEVFGRDIAFGITPKIMHITTYDFFAEATTGDYQDATDDNKNWDANIDIGLAHQINSHWRIGLVAKYLRWMNYTTSLGNKIEFRPQVRVGVMHHSHWGLYALDVDITKNKPVSRGNNSQVVALGGEWQVLQSLKLRSGYTFNLEGVDAGRKGLFTWGSRWDFFSGFLDVTFAQNSYETAFGLQVGVGF